MRLVKRGFVTVAGLAVAVLGVVLMPLPGPGFLLVVAGLGILATEYMWARRLVVGARKKAQEAQEAAVRSPWRTAGTMLSALGLVAVGVLTFVVRDVAWPLLDGLLDRLWSPYAGGVLVASGCILILTTYLTARSGKAEPSCRRARPPATAGSRGATRVDPGRR